MADAQKEEGSLNPQPQTKPSQSPETDNKPIKPNEAESVEAEEEEEGGTKSHASKIFQETFMGLVMQSGIPGLAQRMTPANIDKAIDVSDKRNERSFNLRQRHQWFQTAWIAMGVLVLFGLIYSLKDNQPLLQEVLKSLFIFAGGLGGGYGIAKFKRRT